jgi:hypothetical protein
MPVIRYFVFVGGALLALLLAIDLFAPPQPVVAGTAAASIDKTVVRIRSDQKLPERVVYDTSLPTIVPPVVTAAVAPPVPPAAAAAEAHDKVRETFAQFVPESKKPEIQAQHKRKVARARPAHAQPSQVRVAQQSQFGFFGAPGPRSTWTW